MPPPATSLLEDSLSTCEVFHLGDRSQLLDKTSALWEGHGRPGAVEISGRKKKMCVCNWRGHRCLAGGANLETSSSFSQFEEASLFFLCLDTALIWCKWGHREILWQDLQGFSSSHLFLGLDSCQASSHSWEDSASFLWVKQKSAQHCSIRTFHHVTSEQRWSY